MNKNNIILIIIYMLISILMGVITAFNGFTIDTSLLITMISYMFFTIMDRLKEIQMGLD